MVLFYQYSFLYYYIKSTIKAFKCTRAIGYFLLFRSVNIFCQNPNICLERKMYVAELIQTIKFFLWWFLRVWWKLELKKILPDQFWICIMYNVCGKEMVEMVCWMYYLLSTIYLNQGLYLANTWKYNPKALFSFTGRVLLHLISLNVLHHSWKIHVYSF